MNLGNAIVIWLLTVFGIGIFLAEILSTYSPPSKTDEDLIGYGLKRNIYRMSLVVVLEIGVFVVWLALKI